MNKLDLKCPMCTVELTLLEGTRMDPKDGITLYCNNLQCPAQEVMGHGKNEAEAFEVITQKFKFR